MAGYLNSKPSLLIVDDNSNNLLILTHYFTKFGYEVICAESGKEALSWIDEGDIDLVLLDIMMPDMDGYEVLTRIRNQHSAVKLPVIMSTSVSESQAIIRALSLGANDYISKPIEPRVADARIRTHLNLKSLAEERDHLLDMASHDIKKPVILIEEITHAIGDENPGVIEQNPSVGKLLGLLTTTAQRLGMFVNDFLEMRVLENGTIALDKRKSDLNKLISDLSEKLQKSASKKSILLRVHLDDELPDLSIDMSRISQVFENLVGNAIKFSQPETKIEITTKAIDENVICNIVDQGPGIRSDEFPKLFRKFASLSNKPTANETSTGLGLAICKELIDLHGGEITVQNNDASGATFSFSLPVDHGSAST